MRLLCTLGLFLALLHVSTSLLLGAFNIKSFGETKASKPVVMKHISAIVSRYDIIVIQEVRDTKLIAVDALMKLINTPTVDYKYEVSDLLGPSTYKERYFIIYRHQLVSVTSKYQYPRPATFSRPPFIVRFSSPQTTVKDFALIPQHTSPPKAVAEIDALFDVLSDPNIGTTNIVLLGDFNAGCSYVKASDWQKIRLYTQPGLNWLIGNNVDTTVSRSNCPYDRIVATNGMMGGVKPGTAVVYDYEKDMRLTPKEAADVSDHFPVEVELK